VGMVVIRKLAYSPTLNVARPEPLVVSLLRCDRTRFGMSPVEENNLVSSRTQDGKHAPIIDLDFPHRYVQSSTPGHAHLYLNVEVSWWRWALLQLALWLAGVQELGYSWWSLRRGANCVRPPGEQKTLSEFATSRPTWGVLLPLRRER